MEIVLDIYIYIFYAENIIINNVSMHMFFFLPFFILTNQIF